MAAVPRCQAQPKSRCCPCMKNGRCVRCQCVKKGQLCIDCWPSSTKPSRCENRCENSLASQDSSTAVTATVVPNASSPPNHPSQLLHRVPCRMITAAIYNH